MFSLTLRDGTIVEFDTLWGLLQYAINSTVECSAPDIQDDGSEQLVIYTGVWECPIRDDENGVAHYTMIPPKSSMPDWSMHDET